MAIGAKHPIASGSVIRVLSIINDNSCRFLNSIHLHVIDELLLTWEHVRILISHVSEIVQIDVYCSRQVSHVISGDIRIHRAIDNFQIKVLSD
jgi:hypothetical protein